MVLKEFAIHWPRTRSIQMATALIMATSLLESVHAELTACARLVIRPEEQQAPPEMDLDRMPEVPVTMAHAPARELNSPTIEALRRLEDLGLNRTFFRYLWSLPLALKDDQLTLYQTNPTQPQNFRLPLRAGFREANKIMTGDFPHALYRLGRWEVAGFTFSGVPITGRNVNGVGSRRVGIYIKPMPSFSYPDSSHRREAPAEQMIVALTANSELVFASSDLARRWSLAVDLTRHLLQIQPAERAFDQEGLKLELVRDPYGPDGATARLQTKVGIGPGGHGHIFVAVLLDVLRLSSSVVDRYREFIPRYHVVRPGQPYEIHFLDTAGAEHLDGLER